MSKPGVTAIRVVKMGRVFHVHGEHAGTEGVWLAKGQVKGIFAAPVKTTWKTGAFEIGSRQKSRKFLHRDLDLGFHITDTATAAQEINESEFLQVFDFEQDLLDDDWESTRIEVDTEISGTRKLDVLQYEEMELDADLDPVMQQHTNIITKLRAGQPFWYEDDVVSTFSSGSTSASGSVTVANPGDQDMFQKWVLTPAVWTLPDFQWVGPPGEREPGGDQAARTVTVTVTTDNGGAVIDLDRRELMIRDLNGTNILAQQSGIYFVFDIPAHTPPTDIPVSYTGASGGAMARLVQPTRWSRPWGLEAFTVVATPPERTTRFQTVGDYEYQIPAWADALDILCLGGGGGGSGGSILTGTGGAAGTWDTATVVRGEDIPADTTSITGWVGNGGDGGHYLLQPGTNGEATTATAVGMSSMSAAGGAAMGNAGRIEGASPGSQTVNGITYYGGPATKTATPELVGNPPGGGGAGGWPLNAGRPGARGQVWIRAYQLSGS